MFHRTVCYVTLALVAGIGLRTTVHGQEDGGATWALIQQRILDVSCAGCHAPGTSFARQSELILTADTAYEQLVEAEPRNGGARSDGFVRVSNAGGQPGLARSFLWEKINVPGQDHFYEDHPEYGAIMPLGLPSLTNGEIERFWQELGVVEVETISGLPGVYIVRSTNLDADDAEVAELLSNDDRADWANPDFRRVIELRQVGPQDTFFPNQWHLNNTGQSGGAPNADINALEAWEFATGAGVVFGMLDDSCDVTHEDLAENYIGIGQDLEFGLTNPEPKDDTDAHGTAVMGLAVAAGNSFGVRGVSYQSKFTASRMSFGNLRLFDLQVLDSTIAGAYPFAMNQGVDVHINSWGFPGGPPDPPVIVEAIDRVFREGRDPDGPGGVPALGMVVVFASGNDDREVLLGFDLSQLRQVIGIGATTHTDERAFFSNFGQRVNILAPGFGLFGGNIVTTDTEDNPQRASNGYNDGGSHVLPGTNLVFGDDIDPEGKYHGFFGGTSAACPIAAGVAGLVLSANPNLTATNVRILMEHSTDQVNPAGASYDSITSRSRKYGYGRINALIAVQAAAATRDNGNRTWPDTPSNTLVDGTILSWDIGINTNEYLVLETTEDFDLIPPDGACFDDAQLGCFGAGLAGLPGGARVLFVGCENGCVVGTRQSVEFVRPQLGAKLFAIYGRDTTTGRYSFGTTAEAQAVQPPNVTISASLTSGRSPLAVRFNGNATSELLIDGNGTEWDFDFDNLLRDDVAVNSREQFAEFVYIVSAGITQTFRAVLTMRDVDGIAGSSEVRITVEGAPLPDDRPISQNEVEVIVGLPGAPGSNISFGRSPLTVELHVESKTVGSVQSVDWDLGDGTTMKGLVITHTYTHEDSIDRRFIISATVRTVSDTGSIESNTASTFLTVSPGQAVVDTGEPNLDGTTPLGPGGVATPCGLVGMIPLLVLVGALRLMRKRKP